jgi:hypothetical protein
MHTHNTFAFPFLDHLFTSFATTTGTIGPLGKGTFSCSSEVGERMLEGAWHLNTIEQHYMHM